MLESDIQKHCVKYARTKGWLAYKWSSPGCRGVHDYLMFKGGFTVSIEFKATGKKPTSLQIKCSEDLYKAGIPSVCVDSIQDGKRVIDLFSVRIYEGNTHTLHDELRFYARQA